MKLWKPASERLRQAVEVRPALLAVLAFVAVVALVALLVWFIVFSGLSEPIQFIYSNF